MARSSLFFLPPVFKKVFASVAAVMISASIFGQQKKPLRALVDDLDVSNLGMVEVEDWNVSPDTPLTYLYDENDGPDPNARFYYAENETETETKVDATLVEKSSSELKSIFALGEKTDFEGFRTTNIGENGMILLIEDTIEPLLYLRLEKLNASSIEIRMYADSGELIFQKQKKNLLIGMEFVLNHSEWPIGTHTLQIRADNGKVVKKYIKKNSQFVMR